MKVFDNYSDVFQNFFKSSRVETKFPIVSQMILYDSSRTLSVTTAGPRESFIEMYDLNTYKRVFEEQIAGTYVKIKEVEQNDSATKFAAVYNDDGVFKIRSFGKKRRSTGESLRSEVNLNDLLGLNTWTMTIDQFSEPYVTCCFIDDNLIFVNLFHNQEFRHFHFILDTRDNTIIDEYVSKKLDPQKKNFPVKCFYNKDKNEIYSFYR